MYVIIKWIEPHDAVLVYDHDFKTCSFKSFELAEHWAQANLDANLAPHYQILELKDGSSR